MTQKALPNLHLEKYTFRKNKMLKRPLIFFSTGFFIGYMPFAPGTFGTLVGLVLVFLVSKLSVDTQIILFIVYFLVSYSSIKVSVEHFKKSDPPEVVCDEILGIWVTLILFEINFKTLFMGFVLFRVFDIIKPFPIRYIDQKLKNPLGVILDDIIAGVIAKGFIWLIIK